MKNVFLGCFIMICLFIFNPTVYATQGCCSSHGGVNCAKIQADGTVVCNDGWLGSSCSYDSMAKCASSSPSTIGSTPSYIYGCTDPTAKNYNSSATRNDGSCIKKILGCTDANAFNYNSSANTNDNSCIKKILGCTDANAFNYNSSANTNDNSCIAKVMGCTNKESVNYNVNANTDDGTCIARVDGCTDKKATNYNSSANHNDGSCKYDSPKEETTVSVDDSKKADETNNDVSDNATAGILGTIGAVAWIVIKKVRPKFI